MSHTKGKWELIEFCAPIGDWTGCQWVIRGARAPGGIAVIMGGLGREEEKANAVLVQNAPRMLFLLSEAKTQLTHSAPRDCWANGPHSGDLIEDYVVCPGCRLVNEIARLQKELGITP